MSTFLFLKALTRDIQLWKSILVDVKEYTIAYTPDNVDPIAAQAPEYFAAESDDEAERIGRQKAIELGWATEADFHI